jgi:hypothetical protein
VAVLPRSEELPAPRISRSAAARRKPDPSSREFLKRLQTLARRVGEGLAAGIKKKA